MRLHPPPAFHFNRDLCPRCLKLLISPKRSHAYRGTCPNCQTQLTALPEGGYEPSYGIEEQHMKLPLPHRAAIVAVEGPNGVGKTTLIDHLAPLMRAGKLHRPMTTPPPDLIGEDLCAFMDADQEAALRLTRHISASPLVLSSRWWLSKCLYNTPDTFEAEIANQQRRFGEPDVWIIMNAPAPLLLERRAARQADGESPSRDPLRLHIIAGRVALYDAAVKLLKAPVIMVNWRNGILDITSPADVTLHPGGATPAALAANVARHLHKIIAELPPHEP